MADEYCKILEVTGAILSINKSNPPQLVVFAKGTVPTTGWKDGTLIPYVYIDPPADGILDMDFIALRPDGPVLEVISPIEATGEFVLESWIKGIRIHSASNTKEFLLSDSSCIKDATSSKLAAAE